MNFGISGKPKTPQSYNSVVKQCSVIIPIKCYERTGQVLQTNSIQKIIKLINLHLSYQLFHKPYVCLSLKQFDYRADIKQIKRQKANTKYYSRLLPDRL